MKSNRIRVGIPMNIYVKHIIFWLLFCAFANLMDAILYPNYSLIKDVILVATHNAFLFYAFLFCLNFCSQTGKMKIDSFAGLLSLSILIFYCIRFFFNYNVYPVLDDWMGIPRETIIMKKMIIDGIFWLIEYFFFAAAYFYFQSSIQKQKDLLKSQEEKLTNEKEKIQLEKENIQLENTALRAQINPHFLYNTLDFLYAKALPVSDELSDGVMKLSDIMRYSLKPQDAEGMVFLADEAEHIQNIIEMNQLRFDHKLNVAFKSSYIPDNVKIIPLLLITMVENVFKHGTTNSPEFPATILLAMDDQEILHFSTHNKKRTGPKEHSTGIGLNNTLKRLTNAYHERCNVTVADDADEFKVEINIQLLRNENDYLA